MVTEDADQVGRHDCRLLPPGPHQRLVRFRVNADQQQPGLLQERDWEIGLDRAQVENDGSRAQEAEFFKRLVQGWYRTITSRLGEMPRLACTPARINESLNKMTRCRSSMYSV